MNISKKNLQRGIEVDYPVRRGKIKALRFRDGNYEFYDIKTGEVDYRYSELERLVGHLNRYYRLNDKVVG